MKKKLITIGAVFMGLLCVGHSQTLITNIPANPLWTDTGIALTNGEWVNINAEGFWNWHTPPLLNDPDGALVSDVNDAWLNIGVTHASLIAFVGSDPYQGSQWEAGIFQTNQYLEVGTARQFQYTGGTNGELWLGINADAFIGTNTFVNSGSNYVAISTGFSGCDNFSNLTVSVASVTSNVFSFFISNGIPNTICAIYDSADLTHWTLVDSIKLDAKGSSRSAVDNDRPSSLTGLTNGAFVSLTAVPYRFYKVSNGPFWSQAIGYERMTVGPGTTNTSGTGYNTPGINSMIADQLIASTNTLNGLFDPMVDHSTLPDGSQIMKWDTDANGFVIYTYSGGSWSPNGNATLLPGEGAFLYVTNTTTITFAGLVPQGCLTNYPITNELYTLTSSMVPQAGGVQSKLRYDPITGDSVLIYSPGAYDTYQYIGTNGTGLTYPNDWLDSYGNFTNEPTINVGESFFIQNAQGSTEYWTRKFPGCCDP